MSFQQFYLKIFQKYFSFSLVNDEDPMLKKKKKNFFLIFEIEKKFLKYLKPFFGPLLNHFFFYYYFFTFFEKFIIFNRNWFINFVIFHNIIYKKLYNLVQFFSRAFV